MSRRPTLSVLKEMVAEKMSDPQIASEFGVSSRTVLRWRTDAGISSQWEPDRHGHGTMANYQRGCRCRPCTDANTEYHRRYTGAKPQKPAQHGSSTMYNKHRCRCDVCRAGQAARARAHYAAHKAAAAEGSES